MSNPEWCRVIYDGLLASGSTAMFYRQAMMGRRQLHPCVAGEGPDLVGRRWDRACCRDKGRLDIADRQCPGVTVEIVKRLLVDIDLTPVLVHLLSHRNNSESVLNTRGLRGSA
jgi:hypothetical protein